jgi:hypothetical protein
MIDPITRQPSESRRALLDRFPFIHEVKWPAYDAEHYSKMFTAVLKDPKDMVARMCETAEKFNSRISPRTAILMAISYTEQGMSGIKGFADISPSLQAEFNRIERSFENERKVVQALEFAKKFMGGTPPDPKSFKDIASLSVRLKNLQAVREELTKYPAPMEGDLVTKVSHTLSAINEEIKNLSTRSVELITR